MNKIIHEYFKKLGRKGGSSKSLKKAEAARRNGKKGWKKKEKIMPSIKTVILLFAILLSIGCSHHKNRNSTTPITDITSVWTGDVSADGNPLHINFNLHTQSGETVLGEVYGFPGSQTISMLLLDNQTVSFTISDASGCSSVTGTGNIEGDQMSIQINGPSNCNITYASIQGSIYRP